MNSVRLKTRIICIRLDYNKRMAEHAFFRYVLMNGSNSI